MCVYGCLYECMLVYVSVCELCGCMCAGGCVRECACVRVLVYVNVRACVYVSVRAHVCIREHVCVYVVVVGWWGRGGG